MLDVHTALCSQGLEMHQRLRSRPLVRRALKRIVVYRRTGIAHGGAHESAPLLQHDDANDYLWRARQLDELDGPANAGDGCNGVN